MSKVTIVGAGKTGRGFIARLAAEAGRGIVFVDRDAALTERLNRAGKYRVSFFGGARKPVEISDFRACTWEDAPLEDAGLVFVSVGGQNLADVGGELANRLPDGCCVIACENASSPADKLAKAMGHPEITVSEAAVFCTTIEDGGIDIASENYPYLQCDADRLKGFEPDIPSIRPVGQFGSFLTRKLYTYNAASCVIAYLGAAKGYSVYSDAANDPEILALLDRNYAATNRAMCMEFGYGADDQAEFAALSRAKFTSTAIRDTVERNARDVARKMAPGERIIGVMEMIGRHGVDTSVLEMTAAAALLYAADPAWQQKKAELGCGRILREFCGLEDEMLVRRILGRMERLSSGDFAI